MTLPGQSPREALSKRFSNSLRYFSKPYAMRIFPTNPAMCIQNSVTTGVEITHQA